MTLKTQKFGKDLTFLAENALENIIIIIIIICSFCKARHINPLGSQGAAVCQPQRTHR